MKYKSPISESIHQSVERLHKKGFVDKVTMHEFDKSCLVPEKIYTPEDIKKIREKTKLSQPVFAAYMRISKGLLSDWERGVKKPSGTCEVLLNIIDKHGIGIIPTETPPPSP